jgi:dCTP diphosphatase
VCRRATSEVSLYTVRQVERTLSDLRDALRQFAVERDWQQFHTPRNLAMALAGEVGELLAELQWLRDDQISDGLDGELGERLRDEVADVLIYLVRFVDVCNIDLVTAACAKIERNSERYPARSG